MSQFITLPVKGLSVDPNPLTQGSAGRGALCRAENVMFDRPGTAMSRVALRTRYFGDTDDEVAYAIKDWSDGTLISVGDAEWKLLDDYGTAVTGEVEPPNPNFVPMQFVEGRKSMYYTSTLGTRKLPSGSTTSMEPGAWVIPWYLYGFANAGGQLGDGVVNYRAAYRFVYVTKDANGYIRRSAPGPRLDLRQDGTPAVGYGISGRTYLHDGVVEGDIIEVYRTKITAATMSPSEEYYLAFALTITATDVSNGYTPLFSDNVLDAQLGAALYTNPSMEGIESSNELPPKAHLLADFESCTWFGNTSHRQRISGKFINSPDTATVATYTKNATITNGSVFLTGLADTTNLVVGMAVCSLITGSGAVGDGWWGEGSTWLQPDSLIVAITGAGPYTVEMSKPALATATRDVIFTHVVALTQDGTTTRFYWSIFNVFALLPSGFNLRMFGDDSSATPEERANGTRNGFVFVLNAYMWNNQSTFRIKGSYIAGAFGSGGSTDGTEDGTFYLESLDMGAEPITLTTTLPSYFDPPIPTSGLVSDDTTRPHRVYYSKPSQPEAVPIGNFIDIGSEAHPIQALVPAGSSMYVFKTDGVFRISGSAPGSWRVDLVSPNHKLLYGGLACAMNNVAVGWTNQGVVAFSESSYQSLSLGKIDSALQEYVQYFETGFTLFGGWITYWPLRNTLLVGVYSRSTEESPLPEGGTYAFHLGTGEWSKWTPELIYGSVLTNQELVVSWKSSTRWDIRETSGNLSGHDAEVETIFWEEVNANSVVFDDSNIDFLIPQAGHMLKFDLDGDIQWRLVTNVTLDGGLWTLEFEDAISLLVSVASVTLYETITTLLQWQPHGLIGKSSLFRELQPQLVWYQAPERNEVDLTAGAATDLRTDGYDATLTREYSVVRATMQRIGVLREVARSTHFFPYVSMGEPGGMWGWTGLVVEYEPTSEKMKR